VLLGDNLQGELYPMYQSRCIVDPLALGKDWQANVCRIVVCDISELGGIFYQRAVHPGCCDCRSDPGERQEHL